MEYFYEQWTIFFNIVLPYLIVTKETILKEISFVYMLIPSFIVFLVYLMIRFVKKIPIINLFKKHDTWKQGNFEASYLPEHYSYKWKCIKTAPLMSGNGISMWRIYGAIPLNILLLLIHFDYITIYQDILSKTIFSTLLMLMMTDALDGLISRELKNITELGKWLDPFADKVLVLSVLSTLSLIHNDYLLITIVINMIIVDSYGQSLRTKISNSAATVVGKIKTGIMSITMLLMYLGLYFQNLYESVIVMMILSLLLAIASMGAKYYLKEKEFKNLSF